VKGVSLTCPTNTFAIAFCPAEVTQILDIT
jgi:hypothetical protein